MLTRRFIIFNLLGHILPLAVALVSVPVVAHFAGVERLGALGVAWALVGYFGFLDFGLSRVVTRRVAHAAEQESLDEELAELRGFLWWWALPGLVAIALLILAARALFAGFLPTDELGRELAASWPWIAWSVPATLATNWLRGALEGMHRFARVNMLRTVFGGWTYGAPAVAAMLVPTLDAMIAGIVLGRFAALIAHAWTCLRVEPGILLGSIPRRAGSLRLFFQEGGWITVSNVISPLMVYSDRFVLAALLPPKAVAWYVTSQEVMLRTLVIPAALSGVLFPRFARNLDAQSAVPLAALYQRGIRVTAALMLPLCALAAAGAYDGLYLWLGESFARNGYRIVEIAALGIFFNAIAYLPFSWLQAVGKSDQTAKVHLIELPVYAVALTACATQWGIVGAASIWALRVLLDCLVMLRLAGQESPRPVLIALLGGTGLIAGTSLVSGPEAAWQWRVAVVVAATSGAIIAAWYGLLTQEDRVQVLKRRLSSKNVNQ